MIPRHGHAVRIQPGGAPVKPVGPIHIVLTIRRARPDHLDGTVHLLGDLSGANDSVHFEPPAESAAEEMVMYDDLVQRHSYDLRGRGLRACEDLRAHPDFA